MVKIWSISSTYPRDDCGFQSLKVEHDMARRAQGLASRNGQETEAQRTIYTSGCRSATSAKGAVSAWGIQSWGQAEPGTANIVRSRAFVVTWRNHCRTVSPRIAPVASPAHFIPNPPQRHQRQNTATLTMGAPQTCLIAFSYKSLPNVEFSRLSGHVWTMNCRSLRLNIMAMIRTVCQL